MPDEAFLDDARRALTAALAKCEVVEEWRDVGDYLGQDGSRHPWPGRWQVTRPTEAPRGIENWRVARRLVIITPPQEGVAEDSATGSATAPVDHVKSS
jgi:hypothetical protein